MPNFPPRPSITSALVAGLMLAACADAPEPVAPRSPMFAFAAPTTSSTFADFTPLPS